MSLLLTAWSGAARAQSAAPTTPVAPAPPQPDTAAPKVAWDPDWPRFRIAEYFATGIFAGISFAALAIPDDDGRWTSRNGFDDGVRDAMRFENKRARYAAGDASDLTLTLSLNHLLIDSVVVAWWGHGRTSVAGQMTLINFETIAFTTAVTSLIKSITARERPYFRECSTDRELAALDDCESVDRYRSFFSGHTSTAFAAAGLTCMHHAHLPLYGGGVNDALACIVGVAIATSTGALRIASDNHYASDVLGGAAIGLASGLGLPWLLHYRGGAKANRASDSDERSSVSVRLVPGPMSGTLVGEF
jgi:membrane-associated phospholipid phosphatase